MRYWTVALTLSGTFGTAVTASAQAVQLPSFSYFTTSTSVLVPDRGSAFMGGVSRASDGSTSRGMPGLPGPLFGNRGISSTRSAGGMSVSATIHDFEGLDEALLSSLVRGTPEGIAAQRWAAEKGTAVAGRAAGQSVADIQRQQQLEQAALADEARKLIEQGDAALAGKKPGVAKIHYQMAARRATGTMLIEVQAKLRDLTTAKESSQVAGP